MRYRSGFYPSLHDRKWPQKRRRLCTVCILFTSVLFASLLGSLIVGAFVAFVVFVLAYGDEDFRRYFNGILSSLIGTGVSFLIKLIMFQSARINWYGAFMRRKPAPANLYNTFSDAWYLLLSIWCIIMRLVKLIGILLIHIGRIEAPFFHPSITLFCGNSNPEVFSLAFEKDVLLHEAHRHPYIERIGYLYLLKIGCREHFGMQEGAAWRILFTLALFPWLGKFRLNHFHQKVLMVPEEDDARYWHNHVLEVEKKLNLMRKTLKKQLQQLTTQSNSRLRVPTSPEELDTMKNLSANNDECFK